MSKYVMLYLALGEFVSSFSLEKAVCNHGFFMMAPNQWIPSTKTLQRPLRLANSTTSVLVSITHPTPNQECLLHIRVHDITNLLPADQQAILEQVARMLHISKRDEQSLREFHELHSKAKENGFGRLFRSPTLFEDMVKVFLLCNMNWGGTLDMAKALCSLQGPLKNFPSSNELAAISPKKLMSGKLGYRRDMILNFARLVESGKFKLNDLEQLYDIEEASNRLLKIQGFGSFACANVLMCMGFYQKIPADSESVKLLKKIHSRKDCKKSTIEEDIKEIYDEYAPFQCLAYWFELCQSYEHVLQKKLHELSKPEYNKVTIRHGFKEDRIEEGGNSKRKLKRKRKNHGGKQISLKI